MLIANSTTRLSLRQEREKGETKAQNLTSRETIDLTAVAHY